ncbi:MAG: beta-galactosidase [Victivallaceae bacterium]|nr:beta-galactosidase [Victivallaceae bacterium]
MKKMRNWQQILNVFLLCGALCAHAESWRVDSVNGVPRLLHNGQPVHKRMFWGNPYYAAHRNGVNTPMYESVKMGAEIGDVSLVSFEVRPPWNPEHTQELAVVGEICEKVLASHPNVRLIPRVKLYEPQWWREKYPDEMMRREDGSMIMAASPASEQYRRDAGETLRRTIRYLERRFPGKIAGYHPAGGNSCEWFYKESQMKPLNGYDVASAKGFRVWLKKRYGTAKKLQEAWNDPSVTFDNAKVPTPAERRGTVRTALRSGAPGTDRKVVDFVLFQNDSMADTVLYLGKIIREECGKDRLSLLFFGYVYELANLRNGPGNSGHLALRRILDSKYFDVITAPFSYSDRTQEGAAGAMAPAESIQLAGMLWLNEDDTSTHLAYLAGNRAPGWNLGATTLPESVKLLRRNLLVTLSHNYGTWWMDLNDHGWFLSKDFYREVSLLSALEKLSVEKPAAFTPPIAVVADPVSQMYLVGEEASFFTTSPSVCGARKQVSKVAAASGLYLQDDLLQGRIKPDLTIYTSSFALGRSDRERLKKIAAESGSIWMWAPGYIDLDRNAFSLTAVQDLTGFEVRKVSVPDFRVTSTPQGRSMGLGSKFGTATGVDPILSPVPAKGDIVLAVYSDGSPAVLLRPRGKKTSIFCGTTEIPAALIRLAAKQCAIPLYCDEDLHVYPGRGFLAFHAPADKDYAIGLGDRKYYNLETGKEYCGAFVLPMKKGESVILVEPLVYQQTTGKKEQK